nr:T9SS type A sorting domain-containing protein [Bacteroidota bacterium]
ALSYKLFRASNNTEYTVAVTYSTEAPNFDGLFVSNGLSVVTDLTLKATGIGEVSLNGLSIYPNPSDGIFTISINGLDQDINYVIVNARGQEVYEGTLLESQEIDLSAEAKGVYFIKFMNENVLRIEKVVLK